MPFGLLAFSRGHFKNSSCEVQPEEAEAPTQRMHPGRGDTWQTGCCHSSPLTRADVPCGASADNPGISEPFPGELLLLPAPQPEQPGSLWPGSLTALPPKHQPMIYRHRVCERLGQQSRRSALFDTRCLAGAWSPRWEVDPSCIPHQPSKDKEMPAGIWHEALSSQAQPWPGSAGAPQEGQAVCQRCWELAPLSSVCSPEQ